MVRIPLISLLFISFIFISAVPVFSQTLNHNQFATLPKDQTVNDTYFATGETVTISGVVNGDAYIAGGNVIVDGTVNGDLLVAGGNVVISGNVTQDVRVVGGQITIQGQVGKNVTAIGGSFNVSDPANIAGGLVAGAGNVNIYAPVGKSSVIGGGNITLGDTIGGNVLAGAGNLHLDSEAQIDGNLEYYADNEAQILPNINVVGTITFHKNPAPSKNEVSMFGSWFFMKIINFLSSLLLGIILIRLAPVHSMNIASQLKKRVASCMGFGFLTLVGTPVVAIMLAITIIGLPLTFFSMVLYCILIFVSKIFVSYWIGLKVLGRWYSKPSPSGAFGVGLILWFIVTSIPLIGWVLSFLSLIAGMGAILLQKRVLYSSLREKKLI